MKVNHIRQNVFPVLAALIWGTAFVAQSVGADYVGPFTFTAARSAVADRIEGPWTELGNPARGEGAETTFGTQGTFAWEEQGRIFFLADEWRPENAIDGRYVWLEVTWEGELPVLRDSENVPLPLDPLRA